jgi:NADH:ubiquinone reductase (H+-translocating)
MIAAGIPAVPMATLRGPPDDRWMKKSHRVVILGGGFGGLTAARSLARLPVEVTLVDRRNFHLFQPLLYQVATGALSPANIAAPLRSVFKRQENVRVLLGTAVGLDAGRNVLLLTDGELPYDTLVVATGVRHHYFGKAAWECLAPGLKTIEDATEMRRRILLAFETGEREKDPEQRRALLTFAVVGGGPTGVELAGALAEIARHTLTNEFRDLDPAGAHIVLLEGGGRILPTYPPDLSAAASRALHRLGVTVRTSALVTDLSEGRVRVKQGDAEEDLRAETVLWAAGVAGSPLGTALAKEAGALLDAAGRVAVGPDLALPSHPEIFVVGDLAARNDESGKALPGVAQVAMQEGRHVARVLAARLKGSPPPPPFRYFDVGSMATIGRGAAVCDLGFVRFNGLLAWLAWLFLHLMYIVQFGNRVLIFVQWAWNYLTWNRSARLITERPHPGSGSPRGANPP